jgi:hypothetical protein
MFAQRLALWRTLAAAGAAAAGCSGSEDIDLAKVEVSIADYGAWSSRVLLGPVPAHGDTYRVVYANQVATGYTGGGLYPPGTALVKEIYQLAGDDQQGPLSYIAVMRRIDDDAAPDLPIMGGWLLTERFADGSETQFDLCWDGCHRQAPYAGVWFDYGRW